MNKYNTAEIANESSLRQIDPVMKTKSIKHSLQKGFSLVELLVVIAVIAIIAAIAIPNIANITQQANSAKAQRNAQSIASVAAATVAAGYEPDWANPQAVYDDLSKDGGVQVTNGANTMDFGISPMSEPEVTDAIAFLTVSADSSGEGRIVNYNPSASN